MQITMVPDRMALSKEIISLHHGLVKAESEAQQGAVFTVELLLGKEHYKPSEVDFYVGDGEAEAVGSDLSSAETQEVINEEEGMDASLPTVFGEDNKDLGNLLKLQLEDRYKHLSALPMGRRFEESTFVSSRYCGDRSDDARNVGNGDAATYSSGFPDQSHSGDHPHG
jgi:hypothetical protein